MPAGDPWYIRRCADSSAPAILGDTLGCREPTAGFRIDLIDDSLLLLSVSDELGYSVSPNDRFLIGDRNEAGESDVGRPPEVAAKEVIGASLLSSVRDSGAMSR